MRSFSKSYAIDFSTGFFLLQNAGRSYRQTVPMHCTSDWMNGSWRTSLPLKLQAYAPVMNLTAYYLINRCQAYSS